LKGSLLKHIELLFYLSSISGVAISFQKVYLFHLIGLILLLILIYKKSKTFTYKKFSLPVPPVFSLMILWYCLSLFWVENINYGLKYLFYIACGTFIIFAMSNGLTDLKKQRVAFKVIAYAFIFEITICLFEHLTSFRLPISPLSPLATYVGRLPYNVAANTLDYSIPTGFHWNPNNLAVVMTILLPFFLFYKNKFIQIMGSLSLLILIYATHSRGAMLATIIILIFWSLSLARKLLFLNSLKKSSVMGGIIFCSILFFSSDSISKAVVDEKSSFIPEVIEKFFIISPHRNDSIAIRHYLIERAIQSLEKSHFIGVGAGGAQTVLENPEVAFFQKIKFGIHITSIHNFWIEILLEGGILFFIFLFHGMSIPSFDSLLFLVRAIIANSLTILWPQRYL
jgi:teichuronic acid biosynthesis protein TuaE